MEEPSWLVRLIECYSNTTDEFVCEFVLPEVDLTELQRMWSLADDEPMVDCFPIGKKQAKFLQQLMNIDFDFVSYSYFLTACTTDWEATKREGGYMNAFPPPR